MSRIPNDELHTEKIVYETYFGEMEISDEEKKERLELAKELEPIFISFFYAFLVRKRRFSAFQTGHVVSVFH